MPISGFAENQLKVVRTMDGKPDAGAPQADAAFAAALRKNEEISVPSKEIQTVSPAVVKRLPRYFRFLRELLDKDILRISSRELSAVMQVTASQIRQDLNCFGGFGQQGYGYNVRYLYTKIGEILAVNENYAAILIGVGHLGHAIAGSSMLADRNIQLLALFDSDPSLIGQTAAGLRIRAAAELPLFLRDIAADIAILALPPDAAEKTAAELAQLGIHGIWNFSGREIALPGADIAVENVHFDDSLMRLMYNVRIGRSGEGE